MLLQRRVSMMGRLAAFAAASVLLVDVRSVSANEVSGPPGDVTPVGKVVELLDVLKRQVESDGLADGKAYQKYVHWFQGASAAAAKTIEETSGNIETLKSGIAEQEALRNTLSSKFEKAAAALAKEESELKAATDQRKKERTAFEEAESTLTDGVDSLERSLLVLGKSMPAASAAAGASFLSVAQDLKETFLKGQDLSLTPMQRKELEGFVRAAERSVEQGEEEETNNNNLAPDFLQVRSKQGAPYGEYKSQTGGATATLQSVLEKTNKELVETRNTENTAKTNFQGYEKSTKDGIANKEKTLSEVKAQISHSQQTSSQMQAQLKQNEELFKVTTADLKTMQAEETTKTAAYKERVASRSDEIMAVRQAAQVLTSDTASQILAKDKAEKKAASFLQVASKRRRAKRLLKEASSPGLALAAMRSHNDAGMRSTDPFGKVKGMIQGMLAKLAEQAAKEQKHHEFCTSEMEKSTASEANKKEAIQKVTDRISAMDAELEQLVQDIKTSTEDLAELKKASAEASKVRSQEQAQATAAIQQYKDAQGLITTAMGVLKKHYEKAAKQLAASTKKTDQPKKTRTNMGAGVIADRKSVV